MYELSACGSLVVVFFFLHSRSVVKSIRWQINEFLILSWHSTVDETVPALAHTKSIIVLLIVATRVEC